MSKTLIILLIFTSFLYPQTFRLGFRSESTWSNTTSSSNPTVFIPLYHFYVTMGISEKNLLLLNNLTEEFRFGRIIVPGTFQGNDLSFVLKYYVFSKYTYLSGGLDIHYNVGENDGESISYQKAIDLLVFGIGFSPDNIFFVELSKYIPVSNAVLGEDDYYDLKNNLIINKYKLNSFISIGFGINFEL